MSIQYVKNGAFFRVVFKNWQLVAQGKKHPYSQKNFFVLDENGGKNLKPTAGAIKKREKELKGIDKELEEQSKKGNPDLEQIIQTREQLPHGEKNLMLLPLLLQTAKNPTYRGEGASVQQARYALNRLIQWLEESGQQSLTVNQFTRNKAIKYLSDSFGNLMLTSLENNVKRLRTAFNLMIERNELKTENIFKKIRSIDLEAILNGEVITKEHGMFDASYLHAFFKHLSSLNLKKGQMACFYTLMVTGWRLNDALNLNKSNIDFEANTITLLHSKTAKKSKIKTRVFMTAYQRTLFEQAEVDKEGFFWHGTKNGKEDRARKILKDFMTQNKPKDYSEIHKNGFIQRSHTMHSFRRSVITILKTENINNGIIDFIVGHSGNNIDAKHYEVFFANPEQTTREALEVMENIIQNGEKANETKRGERLLSYAKSLNITPQQASAIFYADMIATMDERTHGNARKRLNKHILNDIVDILAKEGYLSQDLTSINMEQVITMLKEKEEQARKTKKEQAEFRNALYNIINRR